MRKSRGMGIAKSGRHKVPKDDSPNSVSPKKILRKDKPQIVSVYAKGGKLDIKAAIKKPGALHADLGVPQGKKIPAAKLNAAAKQPGKVGQRARFAQTLSGFRKGR